MAALTERAYDDAAEVSDAVRSELAGHTLLRGACVGVAGPIASGKSTLVQTLGAACRALGVPAEVEPEVAHPDALGDYIRSMPLGERSEAGSFQMLMGSGAYAREHYAQKLAARLKVLAVVERPYTENRGFAVVNAVCGKMTAKALRSVVHITPTPNDEARVDLAVALWAPLRVCAERKFARGNEAERLYKDEYLHVLDDALYFRTTLRHNERGASASRGQLWLPVPAETYEDDAGGGRRRFVDPVHVLRAVSAALRGTLRPATVDYVVFDPSERPFAANGPTPGESSAAATVVAEHLARVATRLAIDVLVSTGDDRDAANARGRVFAGVWEPAAGSFDCGVYAAMLREPPLELAWSIYEDALRAAAPATDDAALAPADAFKHLVLATLCTGRNVRMYVRAEHACRRCRRRPLVTGVPVSTATLWAAELAARCCDVCFFEEAVAFAADDAAQRAYEMRIARTDSTELAALLEAPRS